MQLKQVAITVPESAHWYAMLGRAEYMMQDSLPEGVGHYLVQIFFRQDKESLFVLDGQNSFFSNNSRASDYTKLQRLGDKCLLLCGFYPEFCQMYGMDLKNWLEMGAGAYRKLTLLADEEEESIYQIMSDNFSSDVDILVNMQQMSIKSMKTTSNTVYRSKKETVFNYKAATGNGKQANRRLN